MKSERPVTPPPTGPASVATFGPNIHIGTNQPHSLIHAGFFSLRASSVHSYLTLRNESAKNGIKLSPAHEERVVKQAPWCFHDPASS